MQTSCYKIFAIVLTGWVILVSAPPAQADEADDQYAVAVGHYDRQRWKLATEELEAFIRKHPDDRRAKQCVFLLGEALLQLGKFDNAREHFQKYIALDPKGKYIRSALFRSGEAAYLAGNHKKAKVDLDRFWATYPEDHLNAFVLFYLGDIALADNDAAAAADFFQNCLKQFPEGQLQDDCRLGLARALEKQHQMREAERLYRVVADKPNSSLADAAQFHLGALQYAEERYDRAIECFFVFEGAMAQSPWQPNARLGWGLALLKLDRSTEAIKHFDAVLATKSAGKELFQQAIRGKIRAALRMKDHETIDREVADFEKRFPDSAVKNDLQGMLARSLVERKQYDKAVVLLEALAGTNPKGSDNLDNRYLLAISYEGLKRYEDALAALLPVVDNAKGQLKADAQLTQGSLLLALKKYAEAIAPLEAFLAGKPTGNSEVKAIGELALCCARSGQIEKAKKLYADLIERHPQHPLIVPTTEYLAEAAYDADDAAWSEELSARLAAAGGSTEYETKGKLGLGWSQYKSGKLAEAAATFDEVLKKNPPKEIAAEAAMIRGRILEKLGRHEPALVMYDLVIEQHPKYPQHSDALLVAARLRDQLKQHQEAAALYERLVKEHPDDSKLDAAIYEWAWAMQELGNTEETDRLFQRLRKEYPESRFWADATYRLAQRALEAKNYDRANALLDELLKTKTEPQVREHAMYLRGQVAVAKKNWPKAREAFKALIKEFPESSQRLVAEFWVAESFYRQADYAAAKTEFARLAEQIEGKRKPWMATIPLRRAQILAQQEQWSEALVIAAEIEKTFPDFQQQYEVDYLMGRCLADRADFEAAREAYRKVFGSPAGAKTETAAMAQWMIGETFYHQKNFEAALREYLRVEPLYAYPLWQAGSLLQAGKCYELLGKTKQAAELYRRILKVYADTPFVKEATERLTRLEKQATPARS